MKVLAVYYTDPVEGRQKFVITNPSDLVVDHYLWVKAHIELVPDGCALGLHEAMMVFPVRTVRRTWMLDRTRVGAIRLEDQTAPTIF